MDVNTQVVTIILFSIKPVFISKRCSWAYKTSIDIRFKPGYVKKNDFCLQVSGVPVSYFSVAASKCYGTQKSFASFIVGL